MRDNFLNLKITLMEDAICLLYLNVDDLTFRISSDQIVWNLCSIIGTRIWDNVCPHIIWLNCVIYLVITVRSLVWWHILRLIIHIDVLVGSSLIQ